MGVEIGTKPNDAKGGSEGKEVKKSAGFSGCLTSSHIPLQFFGGEFIRIERCAQARGCRGGEGDHRLRCSQDFVFLLLLITYK
jgi:hypothetical protein